MLELRKCLSLFHGSTDPTLEVTKKKGRQTSIHLIIHFLTIRFAWVFCS